MKTIRSSVTGILFFFTPIVQILAQGNVGIGTSNPESILHTNIQMGPDTSLIAKAGLFMSNSDSSGSGSNPNTVSILFGRNGNPRQAIEGGTYGDDYLRFYTLGNFNTPRLTIAANGYVGIGTSNPTKLLDVQGAVALQSLTVESTLNTNQFGVNTINANSVKGNYFTSINAPQNFLDFNSTGIALRLEGVISATQFWDVNNTGFFLDPASPNISLKVNGAIMANGFHGQSMNYFLNLNSSGVSLKAPGELQGSRFKDSADTTESYLDLGVNSISLVTKGDIQSPAFRDKNNPGYYLDPASTGISLKAQGEIRGKEFIDVNNPDYFLRPGVNTISLKANGQILGTAFKEVSNSNWFMDLDSFGLSLQAQGTLRAQKFEDLANTTYYLDPASTSISLKTNGEIHTNGEIQSPVFKDKDNPDYYLDPASSNTSLNTLGNIVSKSFKDADDINYFVDPANTGVSLKVKGRIHADIYKDANDTTYYVNPASPNTSLNTPGNIISKSFKDSDDPNFLLDPASISQIEDLELHPPEDSCLNGFSIHDHVTSDKWVINMTNTNDLGFWYNGILRAYLNQETSVANLDFTAQHRSLPSKWCTHDYAGLAGYIVISDGTIENLNGKNMPTIDEALPRIKLSDKANDKRIYGVVSGIESEGKAVMGDKESRTYAQGAFVTAIQRADTTDYRIIINSAGEGGIWVSNYNGNIQNGDLITTSPIPGIGMKQEDDLIHNYTVAKIVMDCNFDPNSTQYEYKEIEHEGLTYKMAFLGCVYKCN